MGLRQHAVGLLMLFMAGQVALCADIQLTLRPAWSGSKYNQVSNPVMAEISNVGPIARGFLTVPHGSFLARVPVELPRGTTKKVVVYPEFTSYPRVEIQYESDRGTFKAKQTLDSYYPGGSSSYGVITDAPGELSYLATTARQTYDSQGSLHYCLPSEGPSRYVGYMKFAAVFLGSGAERMSDASAEALRDYVLLGGTLVLPGGVPSPIHSDRRLAMLLPLSQISPSVVPASQFFPGSSGSVTTLTGKLNSGTIPWREDRAYRRSYGLGGVIQLAFDPNDSEVLKYENRAPMLRNIVGIALIQRASNQWLSESNTYPASSVSSQANDPFAIAMPPVSKVLTILAIFFVVVVPVNLLILRKLRKGEWAWVTAPIISFLFAGYILSFGKELYSAKLSRATVGTLFSQAGDNESIFVANTQIFFPQGGEYDPKLGEVLSLEKLKEDDYYDYPDRSRASSFEVTDGNELRIAKISTSNLAFEEVDYTQKVPNMPLFKIYSDAQGKLSVRNLTKSQFNGRMIWKNVTWDVQAPPNKIASVTKSTTKDTQTARFLAIGNQGGVVFGGFEELSLGPQIGQLVKNRSRFDVVFCFNKEDIQPQ